MAPEVIWTPRAEADLFKVLEYLEKERGMQVVHSFLDAIDEVISLMKMYPRIFRRSGSEDVREAVVTKHNVLFYRIKDNRVFILALWDPRQDPIKRPFPGV